MFITAKVLYLSIYQPEVCTALELSQIIPYIINILKYFIYFYIVINPDERGTELVLRRQGTSYTGKDIQCPRGWFTADFSVHDDKAIECLNKIFFGQRNREPRHNVANRADEYLHMCRPEPEVTTVKSNRKKCYLDILGEVFRTEKSAVNHPRGHCMSFPVYDVPCRRKTSSVPLSSGFITM